MNHTTGEEVEAEDEAVEVAEVAEDTYKPLRHPPNDTTKNMTTTTTTTKNQKTIRLEEKF